MENFNFTEKQIIVVKELIESLYSKNTEVGSTTKNDHIKMFKDNENNFYVSFFSTSAGELAGEVTEIVYVKVDGTGERTILNDKHDNFYLVELFNNLEPITF